MPFPAFLVGLAVTAALPAAPLPPQVATPDAAPADAAAPDDNDSSAMRLNALEQRMTVAVTINGAGPFRFIVDSGATRTVISSRLAALLKLPADAPVSLHSVGGESTVPTVRIAALGLGVMPAKSMVAPVLDEANLGAAGILGIDALAGKKVVIDLHANRMTVEASDRSARAAGSDEIVVTARRKYGQLILADADAAGQPIYAVVDTGSMVTIANGKLQERLVHRKRIAPQMVAITDVTGREVQAVYASVSDIRLSDWHIHDTNVAFSDAHCFERFGLSTKPSMLLGMDMMRAFKRVSIDFKRRTVRFMRDGERETALPVSVNTTGGAG
jgi:predicted aspartyl protease